MTAITILNVVLSAAVFFGIIGVFAWIIYTDDAHATPDHVLGARRQPREPEPWDQPSAPSPGTPLRSGGPLVRPEARPSKLSLHLTPRPDR